MVCLVSCLGLVRRVTSNRRLLSRVDTCWNESRHFALTISFTSGKHCISHPLPLTTRLPLSRAALLDDSSRCGCIGHGCRIQKFADSSSTLNSRFKISGDMAKPGSFCFGFTFVYSERKNQSGTETFWIRLGSKTISFSLNLVSVSNSLDDVVAFIFWVTLYS